MPTSASDPLSPDAFILKWSDLFAYNKWERVDDATFREFTADIAHSFTNLTSASDPAGGQRLTKLVLPMHVFAGAWYVAPTGIWQAKSEFQAAADPAPGAWWQAVLLLPTALSVHVADILDASEAGQALLKAATAADQLRLLDKLGFAANEFGQHPAFTTAYGSDGTLGLLEYLLQKVQTLGQVQTVQQPAAPTSGQVNDVSKEFSFTVNPAYPSYLQYKVGGLPGTTGPVYLSTSNAYQVNNTVYVKVGSAVSKGNLGVYVAGSGNVPDGKVLTNSEAFTGAATTTPPSTTTPDPPTVAFDTTTRILSASHPSYGTGELEYRRSASTVLAYASIGVDNDAHNPGEWQYRVKAATGRAVSQWADSPAIAAKAVVTPVALAATLTVGSATLTAGQHLSFSAGASGGTSPYSHLVQATDPNTGQVTDIGSAGTPNYNGVWQSPPLGTYDLTDTVSDAAGASKISAVRRVVVSAAPVTGPDFSVTVDAQRGATLTPASGASATDYEYQFRPAPTVSAQRVVDFTQFLAPGESASDYEYQLR